MWVKLLEEADRGLVVGPEAPFDERHALGLRDLLADRVGDRNRISRRKPLFASDEVDDDIDGGADADVADLGELRQEDVHPVGAALQQVNDDARADPSRRVEHAVYDVFGEDRQRIGRLRVARPVGLNPVDVIDARRRVRRQDGRVFHYLAVGRGGRNVHDGLLR